MNIINKIYNAIKYRFMKFKLPGLYGISSNSCVCPPAIGDEGEGQALKDAYDMTGGEIKKASRTPREWGMSRACQRMVNKRKKRDARATS